MNFSGRMPMGFSGAVSLISCAHCGLELTFMGVTRPNSGLFSTPGFIVSPVGKRERSGKKADGKEENKKSSAGFKGVRLVLCVFLSVERETVFGRIGFSFLPSSATVFAVVQPPVQFLRVLLLPTRTLVHQLCCP